MPLSTYLTRLIWLSVLPLVLFSGWLVYGHVRALQNETDQQAGNIARNFATAIDHHLNARIGALSMLAVSPLARDAARWPELYREAQGFHRHFGSHVVFAAADEPMPMLFNTRVPFGTALPPLPRPRGTSAVRQAMATGRPAVGDLFFGPVADEPLVAIAVPVRFHDRIDALLLATFEASLFQTRLEQISLPAGWRLALLDSQGETIALSRHAGDQTGRSVDTGRRIAAAVTAAPWSVVTAVPRDIYFAPMIMAGSALGLGVLAATLIGIGGGLWGKRRLGAAVASLADPEQRQAAMPTIREIETVRHNIDAASRRIASFAAAQDSAIEQERRRVAREVHDQMGQVFTAIKLIVQSVPHEAYPEGQEAALNQALAMGIASARKITAELRPPLLDDLGLAAALEHFARETIRPAGLAFDISILDQGRLCPSQALGLFRIVQESVTNVLRHAGATRIDVSGGTDGDNYRLRIEDDGRGFDAAAVRQDAMGLTNMQERARLMKGLCRIYPRPQGGTVVEVALPLDKPASENADEHPAG